MSHIATHNEQAASWNEKGGMRWVDMQPALDLQLEPFGLAIADKLALATGERVLDVGCGAGATSLMLAERVRPGSVVGVDISAPLLGRARERAEGIANLRFELGDAETFAFDAASYDVLFSRFGVMFFADAVAAFRNLRLALSAGARVGFVCWRSMQENPSFTLPLRAALPYLAKAPVPTAPHAPGPFGFADASYLHEVLKGAGYHHIEIVAHDSPLVFGGTPDIECAVDMALSVGPLSRALEEQREDGSRERIRAALREAFAPHHGPAGVTLPSATWLVTARPTS